MIGYCAVDLTGHILWTVDCIDSSTLQNSLQHVDFTDDIKVDGKTFLGFAGSDRFYLTNEMGETLFSVDGSHVQGCVLGHFRNDSSFQIAVYNINPGSLVLYDPEGKEIWSRMVSNKWPLGIPGCCENRRFHRNTPVIKLCSNKNEWIGYDDGGWPYGIDGYGKISLYFPPPENSQQPNYNLIDNVRGDDIGYGFKINTVDVDNDGEDEFVIYDRRFLWVYKI